MAEKSPGTIRKIEKGITVRKATESWHQGISRTSQKGYIGPNHWR